MNKTALIYLILFGAAVVLSGIGCDSSTTAPGESDTITVAFRDGASPLPSYTGTRDAVIKDSPDHTARNGNYGTRPSDTLGVIDIGGSPFEQRMLVKFDLTSITDCGTLTGATLTINITPTDTSDTIWLDVYEATVPATHPKSWVEGFLDNGVSWLTVDGDFNWTAEGGDVLGLLASKEVKADTVVTFDLDAAVVEDWVKRPWINHGVLIRPRTSGDEAFVYVYMRETTATSLRPELYIKYIKGG
jgi:hypothetical protein